MKKEKGEENKKTQSTPKWISDVTDRQSGRQSPDSNYQCQEVSHSFKAGWQIIPASLHFYFTKVQASFWL